MMGVSDDAAPLFEGRVFVDGAGLAGPVLDPGAENKEVEVMSDWVGDRVAPLLDGVMKIEDVTSTVTGAWLDVDVGAVWGSLWYDDVEGAAGAVAEVELDDEDVGTTWLALGDKGVALGSVLVVEGAAADVFIVVLGAVV